jgi:hypothetical protein
MAGLQKTQLPKKYREMIGNLVAHMEMALERRPVIQLEKNNEKEAAVLLVSDLHAGKRTYDDKGNCTYNQDICAFRLSLLKQRVINLLTNHLQLETIDEFYILFLGDLIDGSGIYPGQELHQDISCVSDQICLAAAGGWDLAKSVSELGLKTRMFGVLGNHGRQHKYAPAVNNFDLLVYQILYMLSYYDNSGITMDYATNTPYLNIKVKGHNIHMRHQAPPQPETPAARAKFGGWYGIHNFDFITSAHLHHKNNGTHLTKDTVMNGSPVGMDDLSELLGFNARPSQEFFGISKKGKSFSYSIYLDTFGSGGEAEELLKRYPMLRTY